MLAKQAQLLSDDLPEILDIDHIRDTILDESALLTWKISNLLGEQLNSPSDCPSSDDFSSANADRNISRNVP